MNIQMPQLGETVTEGTISKWHKKVGETIKSGEILFAEGNVTIQYGDNTVKAKSLIFQQKTNTVSYTHLTLPTKA